MKEIIIKEEKKIKVKINEIELLQTKFLDKDHFNNLMEEMITLFISRLNLMITLLEYENTENEKNALKNLTELSKENDKDLEKMKEHMIANQNTLQKKKK